MTSDIDAYLVCSTPRTGSSLLIGLLTSTGVAGAPQAYFRVPDMPSWARRWNLPVVDGAVDHPTYLRAAVTAGRGDGRVFGAKLMWDSFRDLLTALGEHDADGVRDPDLLERAFGRVRFVLTERRDTVAQAVSWLRAEQTGSWYIGGSGEIDGDPGPSGVARYDPERLDALTATIDDESRSWREWFHRNEITPIEVVYEDLADDPAGTTADVVRALGLDSPNRLPARPAHRRQADAMNREWIERYRGRGSDIGRRHPS